MNDQLPPIPAWQTKSFLIGALLMGIFVCNWFEFDLMAWLTRMGLGESKAAIVENISLMIPPAGLIWMYIERRAPKYRIVFRRVFK